MKVELNQREIWAVRDALIEEKHRLVGVESPYATTVRALADSFKALSRTAA